VSGWRLSPLALAVLLAPGELLGCPPTQSRATGQRYLLLVETARSSVA
jgi:hypothetical protein